MAAIAHVYRCSGTAAVAPRDAYEESHVERIHREFTGAFDALVSERRIDLSVPYRGEREDLIQSLIMAGPSISLIPEFPPALPGLR